MSDANNQSGEVIPGARGLRPLALGAAFVIGVCLAGAIQSSAFAESQTKRPERVDLELEELWRAGDSDDDLIFGSVRRVVQDTTGSLYVLDGQLHHITVFSPDGQHLRTIGREGEGPGEFRRPQDLFETPAGLLGVAQVFPGKIVQLTHNGDPAGTFPLPPWGSLRVFRGMGDRDKLVVAGSVEHGRGDAPGEFVERTFLKAFNADGNETHHYHHEDHAVRYGGMKFREPEFVGFEWRWGLASDGRVAVAPKFDRYELRVFGPDGAPQVVIEQPDYVPVKRTKDERQRWQRYFEAATQWSPGSTFETSKDHPAIESVHFHADGSLWVQSGRGTWRTGEGVLAAFDVYDQNGQHVREVHLHAPGSSGEDRVFLGRDDRVYVVSQFFTSGLSGAEEQIEDAEPSCLTAYEIKPKRSPASRETEHFSLQAERLSLQTEHFSLHWVEGVSDEAIASVAESAEHFYVEIAALLGKELPRKIPILLQGPAESPDRAQRGYPHVDGFGRVHLFRYGGNDASYLSALAHELVHVFRFDRRRQADWFFEEGFAEYVALLLDPSLRGFPWYDTPVDIAAAQWIVAEEDLSLADLQAEHRALNLPCRAQAYTLRSSFFAYLGSTFGTEALLAMANEPRAGKLTDYERFFGDDLGALEAQWRSAIVDAFTSNPDATDLARAYRQSTPIQYMPVCEP